eukprot:4703485-Amphidinium_carterae.1
MRKVILQAMLSRRLPTLVPSVLDLGVDVQWAAKHTPTQQKRIQPALSAWSSTLSHAEPQQISLVRALQPMALCGGE